MSNKEIFYHGSCYLFDKFSLSFLGAGEGKSKFGHGIYITSSYKTAVLYATKAARANGKECRYVYTVEVPQITDDNHIFSCRPDSWGAVLDVATNEYYGKNIMGRLLMELREKKKLEYQLPSDIHICGKPILKT